MDTAIIDPASAQYLGQWKRLVSTTNWDKGRIISEWREALLAAGHGAQDYSDDAWSRHVGSVTPQHVGRLRRVFERFGQSRDQFAGLYWSHFQAALDWDDAEMWLEGAVQSEWSVAQMRRQRWEALGAPAELKPRDEDVIAAELDEDAPAPIDDRLAALGLAPEIGQVRAPESRRTSLPESGQSDRVDDSSYDEENDAADSAAAVDPAPPIRPFANLPSLPADVTDAFEAYKLSIVRHRLDGWREISLDDMLASLDSLKELALAPAQ